MTTTSTSDGELVQAVSEKAADEFYFINSWPSKQESDKDHGGWIEVHDVSPHISPAEGGTHSIDSVFIFDHFETPNNLVGVDTDFLF